MRDAIHKMYIEGTPGEVLTPIIRLMHAMEDRSDDDDSYSDDSMSQHE